MSHLRPRDSVEVVHRLDQAQFCELLSVLSLDRITADDKKLLDKVLHRARSIAAKLAKLDQSTPPKP